MASVAPHTKEEQIRMQVLLVGMVLRQTQHSYGHVWKPAAECESHVTFGGTVSEAPNTPSVRCLKDSHRHQRREVFAGGHILCTRL